MKRHELRALRRELVTALQLALASRAAAAVVDELAAAAGLVEAVSELPPGELTAAVVKRAQHALGVWARWQTLQGGVAEA
jgi:hypothetical protein